MSARTFRHAQRLAAAAREATGVKLRGGHNDVFLMSGTVYRRGRAGFFATVASRAGARREPPSPPL